MHFSYLFVASFFQIHFANNGTGCQLYEKYYCDIVANIPSLLIPQYFLMDPYKERLLFCGAAKFRNSCNFFIINIPHGISGPQTNTYKITTIESYFPSVHAFINFSCLMTFKYAKIPCVPPTILTKISRMLLVIVSITA